MILRARASLSRVKAKGTAGLLSGVSRCCSRYGAAAQAYDENLVREAAQRLAEAAGATERRDEPGQHCTTVRSDQPMPQVEKQ